MDSLPDLPLLALHGIRAGYDNNEVLNGISIKIFPSEIIAIIGPNGAGKSTTLKAIFNLATIFGGSITFREDDITNYPTHELISKGISYVPQGRQIFPSLSVYENLEMGAFTFKNKEERIATILEQFPVLQEKHNHLASTLSGGQQQLLAIARALTQDPVLILLDEPSLGLSPIVMKDIFDAITSIRKKGIAVLMVEQNAKQAINICDRAYAIVDGSVDFEGPKKEMTNSKLKKIYFGGR